jgi:flagellin-like protein
MQNQVGMARRWRQKGKRGVSPIIATILLVAITVVLAAVLYILISGLTKGPGNTPLGSALAIGTPASNGGLTYTMGITPSSGLTPVGMTYEVTSSTGTILGVGTTVTVVGVTGCFQAVYTFASNSWAAAVGGTACAGASTTVVLTSGMQLSLVVAPTQTGLGDKFVAVGAGTFSGQVSASLP